MYEQNDPFKFNTPKFYKITHIINVIHIKVRIYFPDR